MRLNKQSDVPRLYVGLFDILVIKLYHPVVDVDDLARQFKLFWAEIGSPLGESSINSSRVRTALLSHRDRYRYLQPGQALIGLQQAHRSLHAFDLLDLLFQLAIDFDQLAIELVHFALELGGLALAVAKARSCLLYSE